MWVYQLKCCITFPEVSLVKFSSQMIWPLQANITCKLHMDQISSGSEWEVTSDSLKQSTQSYADNNKVTVCKRTGESCVASSLYQIKVIAKQPLLTTKQIWDQAVSFYLAKYLGPADSSEREKMKVAITKFMKHLYPQFSGIITHYF